MLWHQQQGRALCMALCFHTHTLQCFCPFQLSPPLFSWSIQCSSTLPHPFLNYMYQPNPSHAQVISAPTKQPITILSQHLASQEIHPQGRVQTKVSSGLDCLTDCQLRYLVMLNSTPLANQIGGKLKDTCTTWKTELLDRDPLSKKPSWLLWYYSILHISKLWMMRCWCWVCVGKMHVYHISVHVYRIWIFCICNANIYV